MNVTYRREMKHNYLIIEQDISGTEGYEVSMLRENQINGLLKFHLKQIDNHKYFYYEITSRQPLNRILEIHSLNKAELKNLITGIAQVFNRLPAYLLNEDQILLQPEYIYLEPERFLVSLCLVPGRYRKFNEDMTELLRYLLGKVNHQDKECVVMAYALYQESLKDNYGIDTLTDLVCTPHVGEGREKEDTASASGSEDGEEQIIFTDTDQDQIQVFQEFNQMEQGTSSGFVFWKQLFILLSTFAGSAAIIWIVSGHKGIIKYWYALPSAGILTAVYEIIKSGGMNNKKYYGEESKKGDTGTKPESEREAWQLAFYEEKEEPGAPLKTAVEEEMVQTALLTNVKRDSKVKILKSTDPGRQDIEIAYTPYLIGKQEGLVDCVLEGEAISRIHAKVEKDGDDYWICDLNSTNGTYVNGRLLETNEAVRLENGDEIFIANFAFIFT